MSGARHNSPGLRASPKCPFINERSLNEGSVLHIKWSYLVDGIPRQCLTSESKKNLNDNFTLIFSNYQVERELRQQEVMRDRNRKADAEKIRKEAEAATAAVNASSRYKLRLPPWVMVIQMVLATPFP